MVGTISGSSASRRTSAPSRAPSRHAPMAAAAPSKVAASVDTADTATLCSRLPRHTGLSTSWR
ncbi:Uncharacterised protein [Bordetella pertussis]|nr:Uncharacterised protein [Bordetella pertussis]